MKQFIVVLFACVMMSGCGTQGDSIRSTAVEDSFYAELNNQINEAISSGDEKIYIEGHNEDVVVLAFERVIAEHPEYYWLGNGYSYEVVEDGSGKSVTLTPLISNEMKADKLLFDEKVDEIVRNATMEENAFYQIRYIHDYLVDNTSYDLETYNLVSQAEVPDAVYPATTAYGCLIDGKAICSGYAAAFQLLANRLGYECGRVTGSKISGESHEWNYIKLDDEYYFIDVTWDDPISADGTDRKNYSYFCITAEELERSHVISKGQDVPDCNGTKYNYHRYYGLYFEKYNLETICAVLSDSDATEVEIRFSTPNECKKAVKDLFTKKRIIELINTDSIHYSIDEMAGVMKITLR